MTNGGGVGRARKQRGLFEGPQWAESLAAAAIPVPVWDEKLRWAMQNISVQPLENTTPFLTYQHRLIQVSLPNEMLGWVYFYIENDDNNCTLLWIEARWFNRVG
jgi:hypothetical protein